MNPELKQLIEDAAKLLHFQYVEQRACFNPCDPERGDLMKVAEAAELDVNFKLSRVMRTGPTGLYTMYAFTKGDYQSLTLAVLRASSAAWKARNGNAE